MTLSSKDKRIIATAALEEIEPDDRSAKERVLDRIGEQADLHGWLWNQLGADAEFDFELQSGRETILVKLDNNGNLDLAERRFDIRSDAELYGIISKSDH